jgi:hypothetical protein
MSRKLNEGECGINLMLREKPQPREDRKRMGNDVYKLQLGGE